MYIGNLKKDEVKLLIHQALNLVEKMEPQNHFVPRAHAIVITKLEEALLWLEYEGRCAPPEQLQGK